MKSHKLLLVGAISVLYLSSALDNSIVLLFVGFGLLGMWYEYDSKNNSG